MPGRRLRRRRRASVAPVETDKVLGLEEEGGGAYLPRPRQIEKSWTQEADETLKRS